MATATLPTAERSVTLKSARDVTLAVQALESRADTLEKLAKKNSDEGYTRESRTQLTDKQAIELHILPQFRAQQELPLVDPEASRATIAQALRPVVAGRLTVKVMDRQVRELADARGGGAHGERAAQEELLVDREGQLLDALARRIFAYAVAVAEAGYAAGYAAREAEPEVLAHRELAVLGAAE